MKLCTRCKRRKPLAAFSKCTRAKDGRFYRCRACCKKYRQTHRTEIVAYQRAYYRARKKELAVKRRVYRQTHKAKVALQDRGYQFKRLYGITLADFNAMRRKQRGLCALCRKPMSFTSGRGAFEAVVDHCHKTGRVRGLIHSRCNAFLARAGDSSAYLKQAIKYLRKKHQ